MNREMLKAEMNKRKLNGKQLAEMANVSPATISRILSGQRGCTTEMAKKIVTTMKLSNKAAYEIFLG